MIIHLYSNKFNLNSQHATILMPNVATPTTAVVTNKELSILFPYSITSLYDVNVYCTVMCKILLKSILKILNKML